jgi:hypothetical protein
MTLVGTVVDSGGISLPFEARSTPVRREGRRHCLRHRIEFGLERAEFENEVCMDTACLGHVVADLGVGLRSTPISEVEEVVSKVVFDPLLQSGDAFRQLPIRFNQRLVECDLMVQKEPADSVDKPFGESEALRCNNG